MYNHATILTTRTGKKGREVSKQTIERLVRVTGLPARDYGKESGVSPAMERRGSKRRTHR
jgi:hypothetical protein